MISIRLPLAAATLSLLLAACATTSPLPPPAEPTLEADLRLDPRFGLPGEVPAAAQRSWARAITALDAGRLDEAEQEFIRARQAAPGFRGAALGLAIVSYRRGDLDRAAELVDQARAGGPWDAADILAAEIAHSQGRTREAIAIYEGIAASAGDPVERRLEELRRARFDQLFARAAGERPEKSVELLREAIEMVDAEPARLLLARRLIELERYDEARRSLDQLRLRGAADRDQLEELLAEVEFGTGRYQEAIARLEPLARKDPARYGERLGEIKRRWSEANMPPRYQQALASDSLTRTELAILIYWKVPAVRFATDLAEPPIAVDLAGSGGREEMVRAMALGLFHVDPLTRTVSPNRTVTPDAYQRILSRLLRLRGTPPCAGTDEGESGDELDACGIPRPAGPVVTGTEAARALELVSDRISLGAAATSR